jgi:hypothetical protein
MYLLTKNSVGQTLVIKTDNNISISFIEDLSNTDYQEYLKWLSEGNEPLPADEQGA